MENMELINDTVITAEDTSAIAVEASNVATRNKNIAIGGITLAIATCGGVVLYKKVIKPWREKRKAAKAAKAREVAENQPEVVEN